MGSGFLTPRAGHAAKAKFPESSCGPEKKPNQKVLVAYASYCGTTGGVDIGLFAGVLDYSKLSLPMRVVMKQKMKSDGVAEGDYQDWDAIRSWTEGLRSPLMGA